MSRLSSYKNLHKAFERLRLLYEVTIYSYDRLYEEGRKTLSSKENLDAKLDIEIGGITKSRPLKVVTYHSKDVYPQMLRSTLLIRMVAVYEAFLVDSIDEISKRDVGPFLTTKRLDFSQEQLISMHKNNEIIPHIVKKTTRQLSSGGLKEIEKFYKKIFSITLVDASQSLKPIQEIHDRRHLHVHRVGYADDQYAKKYPEQGFDSGDQLIVGEQYFLQSISLLEKSALHIKQLLEKQFPVPPHLKRSFKSGKLILSNEPEALQYISFDFRDSTMKQKYFDLIPSVEKLNEIVAWSSCDTKTIRMIVGGTESRIKRFRKQLHIESKEGKVEKIESFKVKRKNSPNKNQNQMDGSVEPPI